MEHPFGLIFVLRDLDGNDAGVITGGRLNPVEISSLSQLNQRPVVEPPYRDAAAPGLFDDDSGRRSEPRMLPGAAEPAQQFGYRDVGAGHAGPDHRSRFAHTFDAERFLLVFDDDPPDALVTRRHHPAKVDRASGKGLQLQRDVLQDVRPAGTFLQALDEAARVAAGARMFLQRGERRLEAFSKTMQLGGGE